MAIDFTTPLGKVRLLTADLDEANPLISNDVLNGYLGLHSGNHYLAAADALEAMATSEVLLSKKLSSEGFSTDGPAVAKELRAQAAGYRLRAEVEAAGSLFEVVGFDPYGAA